MIVFENVNSDSGHMTTVPLVAPPAPSAPPATVPLTVVIPTLNEGARIGEAVTALVSWVDEVIVVDGGSTDDTVAAARCAGAQVLVVRGETIAAQRNAGIAAARNHWVLALDADERVSPALQDELKTLLNAPVLRTAYRIRFQNFYMGRELAHGPWGRDWHVRLITRDRRWVTTRVHEHLEPIEDVGSLRGTILHQPYRDIAHHVTKIVKYARWGAEDLRARGRPASLLMMITRPTWRFFRDYVLYAGWRDGAAGFIASVLSAFAAFLKYALLFAGSTTSDT